MRQYLDLVNRTLSQGVLRPNRTGVPTKAVFGYHYEHKMRDGFPLLTTKRMAWKSIVVENLWFLFGSRNTWFLEKHGCKFWSPWADEHGNIPSGYGYFWREFPGDDPRKPVDQIKWILDELKRNQWSRRLVCTAWHPSNALNSALPPCHAFWVLNAQPDPAGGRPVLNLHLTQRSADIAVGVPFNLAGYSLLLHLFAKWSDMEPGTFSHTMVDAHVYTQHGDSDPSMSHVPGLIEQLHRPPRSLPKLVLGDRLQCLEDVDDAVNWATEEIMEEFQLEGYNPHPAIKFKVAV